jgi:hypothetical protein
MSVRASEGPWALASRPEGRELSKEPVVTYGSADVTPALTNYSHVLY